MSEVLDFLEFVLKDEKSLNYLSQGSLLGFLIFLLYLEVSPKLGNIWFRVAEDGKKRIQPDSLMSYLSYPFKNGLFWKPSNFDLNFIVFSGALGGLYTLVRQLSRFSNEEK